MKRILWFRRDLRLEDNPLLSRDAESVLPIFIFDPHLLSTLDADDKRVAFIFKQVLLLKEKLKTIGLNLAVFHAVPGEVFSHLKQTGMEEILASGDYDAYALKRDQAVSKILPLKIVQDTYLFTPDELLKQDGTPYRVFTPFYKNALNHLNESHSMEYHRGDYQLQPFAYDSLISLDKGALQQHRLLLENLGFSGQSPDIPSANECLQDFKEHIDAYEKERDFPHKTATSKLGVHLRFGTLSIREVLRILTQWEKEGFKTGCFIKELIWREFYATILYHFPHSESDNFLPIRPEWDRNENRFESWCRGETGIPIVDAGMRELNTTGHMHNRVRMIVSSFLTKDLHIDWIQGEKYFASRLLDYDSASNIGSWQWAASTGTDAQPYFRIFNPYLQSKRFDSDAIYIKQHIPELRDIPAARLHNESWLLTNDIPGYTKPIIVHKVESQEAIRRFKHAPTITQNNL